MSALASITVFVISVPFSIWWLATLCAALDEPAPTRPLIRAVLGLIAVLVTALLTNPAILTPVLWALAIVTLLHVAAHWAMANLTLGAKNYDEEAESFESEDSSH